MDDLRNLYQEMVLDHKKNPRNYGELLHPTHKAEGFNPLCGDHFWIELIVTGDDITEIKFHGEGCALSTASASLLTENMQGKTVDEAKELFDLFIPFVTEKQENNLPESLLIFSGVHEYPMRMKCVTLPWRAFEQAVGAKEKTVTTE